MSITLGQHFSNCLPNSISRDDSHLTNRGHVCLRSPLIAYLKSVSSKTYICEPQFLLYMTQLLRYGKWNLAAILRKWSHPKLQCFFNIKLNRIV